MAMEFCISRKTAADQCSAILSMKDLGVVHTKLYDARAEWFEIGLALNISNGTLEAIEVEQLKNQGKCLRKMLAHRIQYGDPLTWTDLCSCLESPTVGRRDLAEEIDKEPLKFNVKTSASSAEECEDIVQVIDKCPGVSIEGLKHESNEIEGKFAKLVASTYQSLIARNISKESLVACLMGFNCLTKVFRGGPEMSEMSKFRKQRRKFDDPSASMTTVWNIIGDYFSFFDYDVLEIIVDTLGTNKDKQKIAEYKKSFKAYASRRLFIEVTSKNDPSPNEWNVLLFVMLDSSYDDCEIGHLKKLKANLSEILTLSDSVLVLRKIRKGSIHLVFEIPDFITEVVFPLSPDQESALGELGVTQLDCGDYHFRAKGETVRDVDRNNNTEGPPPPDPPPKESLLLHPPADDYIVDTSSVGDSLSDSRSNEEKESGLPLETLSMVLEYVQTFGYQQLISAPHKRPGSFSSDSGIGKTRTTTQTVSSLSQLKEYDEDPLGEFHIEIDYLKLASNEPPPLEKMASCELHSAVFNGELAKVRLLVEVFLCSPLAVNREGHTALHIAAIHGKLAILRYFVEKRLVNAAIKSVSQETPLHCAAENGHFSIVKYIVGKQQVDPLMLDEHLISPLHNACLSGSLSTVQYLMQESQQQPCDLDLKTSLGRTLIHFAAESGSPEVIGFLLTSSYLFAKRETVESKDKVGITALVFASYYGHLKAVQLLLQMGAYIDSQTTDGWTALHFASQNDHCEVVKILTQAEADINIKDSANTTALHLAGANGCDEVIGVLLASKAKVNTQNKWGRSPLWLACWTGHKKCAKLLIEAGADVDIPEEDGYTAIHVASEKGNIGMLKILLEAKSDVNMKNKENQTALHLASMNGHDEVVKYLLAAEAEVNTQSKSGLTPLWSACSLGHEKCVELLIEAGASVC